MTRVLWAAAALLLAGACASEKEAVRTEQVYRDASGVREGRVAAVDDHQLVLLDPGGASAGMVFDVSDDTAWMDRGESVRRSSVAEGDPVRVFYSAGDRPDALRVEILRGDEADAVEDALEDEMPGE